MNSATRFLDPPARRRNTVSPFTPRPASSELTACTNCVSSSSSVTGSRDTRVSRSSLSSWFQGHDIGADADVIFGGDGFEPALKFFAVGDVFADRHGLQADVVNPIHLYHPLNSQPEGEHFLAETGRQRVDQIIHGLFVLFGQKFILQDGQIILNAIVSILMNKGGGGRRCAPLRLPPLLPSQQINRQ